MSFNMYTEIILDLYKNPRNKGTLDSATHTFHKNNPLCGDELTLQLQVDSEGKIVDVTHSGHGCAISQASASLFTDYIKGKTMEDLKKIKTEDVIQLLEIPISPGREKCALLVFEALKGAVENNQNARD